LVSRADFEIDQVFIVSRKSILERIGSASALPLTEPGVNVKEGDYLIAVNGRALKTPQNPYELFVNTANDAITLTSFKSVGNGDRAGYSSSDWR